MHDERDKALQKLLEVTRVSPSTHDTPVHRMVVESVEPGGLLVSGLAVSGAFTRGMRVTASSSNRASEIESIRVRSEKADRTEECERIELVLSESIDAAVGDLIVPEGDKPEVADQFAAHLIWLDADDLLPERSYQSTFVGTHAALQVTDLVHKIDPVSHEHLAAKTLGELEVCYCKLALDRAVACDPYVLNAATGVFNIVDPQNEKILGVGIVDFPLRRSSNIEWHDMKVDKASRARANQQKPCVLWFTGLSGSGKSTIADRLEQKLQAMGKRTYLLDGDNVRHGLNKDLGFTDQDRVENIRRVAEVAKLMVDAGLIVVTSFISPFRAERQMAREMMEDGEFIEVFVDTPLDICEQRDPKGLYKKAREGTLKNFTGIDSDYEIPVNAELVLKSGEVSPEQLTDQIVDYLRLNN